MRGRDNSQELFGVDWDAAKEMPELYCALLCWVILAGGCKRRDKFMDSKWLSEWREGLEPKLYWEMLLDDPAVAGWKYTAEGAVLAQGDGVDPKNTPLSLYLCQLSCAHQGGSCTLCLMLCLLSRLSTDDQPGNIAPGSPSISSDQRLC